MTDAVVAASGTERFRPVLHFSPRRNWLNDPNGLIRIGDTFHLFFQHNPEAPVWGAIAWGHATSTDLLRWTEHEVAIPARPGEMIFSGSVVVDHANTSGLGRSGTGPVVAVFTSHFHGHPVHGDTEAQSLAISHDDGRTFAPYEGNPVSDRGRRDYRDPKVFRWGGAQGHWVMVAVEADAARVVISTSDDLIRWTEASVFTSDRLVGMWECPDLFPLPVDGDAQDVRWVLHLSTSVAGATTQSYVLGRFDGRRFEADPPPAGGREPWSDFGRDDYAAVTFAGLPDRVVMMGWMGQAFRAPTEPWQGIMTLPRELALRTVDGEIRLVPRFVRELDAAGRALPDPADADGDRELVPELPTAARIRCRVRAGQGVAGFVLHADRDGGGTRVVVDGGRHELVVDRSRSGVVDPSMRTPTRVPLPTAPPEGLTLDLVVDAMSVEVIVGDVLVSELVFPAADARALLAIARDGALLTDLRIDDLTGDVP